MVIVMNTSTGKRIEERSGAILEGEFGPFEAEVLNAEWPHSELQLEPSAKARRVRTPAPAADFDPDDFLRNVYLAQE